MHFLIVVFPRQLNYCPITPLICIAVFLTQFDHWNIPLLFLAGMFLRQLIPSRIPWYFYIPVFFETNKELLHPFIVFIVLFPRQSYHSEIRFLFCIGQLLEQLNHCCISWLYHNATCVGQFSNCHIPILVPIEYFTHSLIMFFSLSCIKF